MSKRFNSLEVIMTANRPEAIGRRRRIRKRKKENLYDK
jgi:hypothetical protein